MDTLQPMALPYGATTASAAPCGLYAPLNHNHQQQQQQQQQQQFFYPSTVQYQVLMFQQQAEAAAAAGAARAAASAAAASATAPRSAFVAYPTTTAASAAVAPSAIIPPSASAAAAAPEAVVLPPAVARARAASSRRAAAAAAASLPPAAAASSTASSSSCLALSGSLLSGSGSSSFGGRGGAAAAAAAPMPAPVPAGPAPHVGEKKKTRRQEKRELWGAVVPSHVAKAHAARTGTPVYDNVLLFWYSNAHTKPLERGDSVALSVPADGGCEAAGAAAAAAGTEAAAAARAQRRTPCVGVLVQRLTRSDVKPCYEPCADLKVLRLVSEGEAKHGVRSNGARHRRRSKGVKKASAQVDLCVATPLQYLAEHGPVVSAATESTAPLSSGCSGASTPSHTACGDAVDVGDVDGGDDSDSFCGMPPPQNSTDVAALQEALRHLLSADSNSDLSVAV